MKSSINIRPYQLMCLICRLGKEDDSSYYFEEELNSLQQAIGNDFNQPLKLCCNVESTFSFQNPGNNLDTPESELFNLRRDLTILQRLGLTPGGEYPTLDLLRLITKEIIDCKDICGSPDNNTSKEWKGCRLACSGNYERGIEKAVRKLTLVRSENELKTCKRESAAEVYKQEILEIRPHHLLCMTCFASGKTIEELKPIEEDHLYEVLEICQKNPNIPIKLIAGPCMICTPCFGYNPRDNTCAAAFGMGLRDQKKDLDTLRLLGLKYGDTLSAAKIFNLIFEKIENLTSVCGFTTGIKTGPAWTICSIESDSFDKAKACGLNISKAANH
jgi:hypothetical protein